VPDEGGDVRARVGAVAAFGLAAGLYTAEVMAGAKAGDYLGVNGWVDYFDNVTMRCDDTPKVANWLRWYTYMDWVTQERGVYKFDPTLCGGGPKPGWAGFSFDDWFGKWKRAGLKVNLSLESPPEYCSSNKSNGNTGGSSTKYPPCGTTKGLDPADYRDYSECMYQFVARYGSRSVSPGLLAGDGKSGLGFVDAMEVWNEPNLTQEWAGWRHDTCPRTMKDWCPTDAAQYTACLRAACARSREADPAMPVTGGVTAGFDQPYFEAIRDGGGMSSMDGLNVHTYCGKEGSKGPGYSPEYRDGFREYCLKVSGWRDANAPGKSIWLTEFGWDAHDRKKRPKTFVGATYQEQANYLIRAFVIGAPYLDHAFWFIGADGVKGMSETQFDNCGLVHQQTEANPKKDPAVIPKPAYWYMAQLKREIGDKDFISVLAHDEKGAYAYLFRKPGTGDCVVVAWCADKDSVTDRGYRLKGRKVALAGIKGKATVVTPVDGSYKGKRSTAAVSRGTVRLDLSEKPVFIEYQSTN
jgi:hypothetical protein